MIDWFVLLTPLVLLPIVLLLVFLGCGLGRDGEGVPVVFGYQSLLNTDVQRVEAVVSAPGLTSEGVATFPEFSQVILIDQDTPPLLAAGEEHISVGLVGIDAEGDINCTVTLTRKPTDAVPSPEPETYQTSKSKIEGEDPPSFKLVRDGEDFAIV